MDIEILRSEIERLFSLDELTDLSRDLLGLDPSEVGGASAKASFARALTDRCRELDAVEALIDAVVGCRAGADSKLRDLAATGLELDKPFAAGANAGPFTIAQRIGEGPVAIAYRATRSGEPVILKVLKHEPARDRGAVQRFFTACRLVGRVSNPGLVHGITAGSLPDGRPYFAYADPEGEPLAAQIRREGPLHAQQARPILRAALDALAALHDRALFHGNLKLNNVLVSRDPAAARAVLVDAGAQRLGQRLRLAGRAPQGVNLLGTTTVAPEQLRGSAGGARADVYAVGCVLWEMLTGQTLFQGPTPLDVAVAHLSSEPKPPSAVGPRGWISPELDAFVLSLLRKDPNARPRDARALLEELDRIGRDTGGRAALSDRDFDARVTALVSNPGDEPAALKLEDALKEGAAPESVARAFVLAAETAAGEYPDGSDVDLRKSLLYRAARVYEGAGDRENAEGLYAQILELDPSDEVAAHTLQRLRAALGKYDEVIEMLLARADAATSSEAKAHAMAEIGRLYATDLDDRAQALVAYVQAFCEDPQTEAYAHEVERLAGTDSAKWEETATTCSTASTGVLPDDQRVALFGHLGRWYSEKLSRPDLAVACFQAILATLPDDEGAVAGLAAVYAKAQQWSDLAELLLQRARASTTPSAARDRTAEAADLFAKRLGDPRRARELYEQVLGEDRIHPAASEGLERILEASGEHAELIRLLEARADAVGGDKRLGVLARIADVYENALNDLGQATERYQAVLAQDPKNVAALEGLDRIYNRTGRYRELVAILEREIGAAETPRRRISLCERLANVYEEEFLDHEQAAAACEAILDLDAAHEGALTTLVRHYRALDRWEDVARTYARHLRAASADARRIELSLALAKVLAEQIGSPARAVEAYESVIALDPSNAAALDALARLRAGSGDSNLALQAIETLAEQAATAEAKAEQWMRAAKLLEQSGDLDGAIERYKRALDANPKHPAAVECLRAAYVAQGDSASAVELITRQIEAAEGGMQKARLLGELARLCKYKVGDGARAFAAASQATRLDPTNVDALLVLGDTAFEEGRYLEAAAHYEVPAKRTDRLPPEDAIRLLVRYIDALYQIGSSDKAMGPTEALLKVAPDSADALSRVARVVFDHGDPPRAYDLYRDLVGRFRERMMLSEEADALYRLGESARRVGLLEEAFDPLTEAADLDPTAKEPLAALTKLYEARSDWESAARMKARQVEIAEGDERHGLLLEVADIYANRLSDPAHAARACVSALELRPDDRNVWTRLMQLYSEGKDWPRLVEVVVKLSEFVDDPKQKAKYLHTAAKVSARQVGEIEEALEYYERAIELDPEDQSALDEAIALRREKGDYDGVESLLKIKLERANETSDEARMLETFREIAELYHKNLGWTGAAIDAYEAALTFDPYNQEITEVLAGLYASDPAQYLDKAVAAQRAILRQNPDRVESYKLLRRLYTEVKRADAAWCMCQALTLLNLAEPDEERFFRRMRAEGPAAARAQLTPDDFQQLVVDQAADPIVTAIFTLIEPAIVSVRSQPLAALGYDAGSTVDLSAHASQLGRTIYYAASVLGIGLPPAFENPNDPGALSFLHAETPSLVLGNYGLTAEIPAQTAAFIAARHLFYYRPGMYVRHLVPTGTGLRSWLFGAIKLISPTFPVQPELEGPVLESLAALDAAVVGPTRERLASLVSKLLTSGGAIDLKQWVAAVDNSADRAGLLLAHDLQLSGEIIKALGEDASAVPIKDRLKELILFATSEEYFALRSKLGISIDA